MTGAERGPERVLVWAPTARDAALACDVLARHKLTGEACASVDALCAGITSGAGAALIAEERLVPAAVQRLAQVLAAQPAWSDLPVLVLAARRGRDARESSPDLEPLGNVALLDSPLRVRTLVRAVRSALRARRRQYDARHAIHERDRFLAMLGHELRNPLSAISLASAAIAEGVFDGRHQRVLERQVAQLTRIVDDLLDVARVSSGKIELQRARVDLSSVLEHAVDSLRLRFREAGIALKLSSTRRVIVEGDSARLEQVFGNLLTNALKYTPRGGRVLVRTQVDEPLVVVSVEDTGVGIEQALLPVIFEPFVQAEASLDRSQGGMGVGLSLVRTLVDLHGGSVAARSDGRGRGSRFTVSLPIVARDEARASGGDAPRIAPTEALDLVVVEDNDDARELLVMMLERMGYRVGAASDGEKGLALVVSSVPAAAIVDIGLPALNGYQLAERVRATLGDCVRLIALTGYGQPSDRQRALAAGFDEHLTKPADPPRLERVLQALTARASLSE